MQPAIVTGMRGFINAANRMAKTLPEEKLNGLFFKNHMMTPDTFENGLKEYGQRYSDIFTASGKLKDKAFIQLLAEFKKLGLPKTATWDDYFKTIKKKADEARKNAELIKKIEEVYNEIVPNIKK